MTKEENTIYLGTKVGEKHISKIFDRYFQTFSSNENSEEVVFDFSDVQWITNEGLLALTGLFKTLVHTDIRFSIHFLKSGSSQDVEIRRVRQFVQLWDVWKIHQIVPNYEIDKYFDIDGNFIDRIRANYSIGQGSKEVYDRFGITPFVCLDKIQNYDDRKIGEMLSRVYALEDATSEILRTNNCYLPFHNETLSSIVTKELYENFLDHFNTNSFNSSLNQAFMSLALKRKLDEEYYSDSNIQSILERNFHEEAIPELKSFYFDSSKGQYRNRSLLQLSFVDFGEGIPTTLKKSYAKNESEKYDSSVNQDSKILKYAFNHDSSQHELFDRYKSDFIVPRGLFDLLSIVKRFEGLIIVRSNYGKIAFDFSDSKSIEDSIVYFGNNAHYFPGISYTIYIPERTIDDGIDSSAIKPYTSIGDFNFKKENVLNLSLFDIQLRHKEKALEKRELYNSLFDTLTGQLKTKDETLIYLDFTGYEIDERIAKKIIFYLCTDYNVNLKNNVIVLNPPPLELLNEVQNELLMLGDVERTFKVHPTPFVFDRNDDVEIFWLGIFSESDKLKLDNLLLEDHDLRKSDFEEPESIVGHINQYDNYGNLRTIINSDSLLRFYQKQAHVIQEKEVEKIIKPCLKAFPNSIFLCNGHYYQHSYLQLFDVLSNSDKRDYLIDILFNKIKETTGGLSNTVFIGITSSSHKILDYFEAKTGLDPANFVRLNNYFSFQDEDGFGQNLNNKKEIILLCDVVSTGFMVEHVERQLSLIGSSLKCIGVLVNAIDEEYNKENVDYKRLNSIIVSVFRLKLEKFNRSQISEELRADTLKVVRINPFTNTPITQEIEESNYDDSILVENEEFVKLINADHIRIGYYQFNSLIHPYFFDMKAVLMLERSSKVLLKKVFENLKRNEKIEDVELLFYPKSSAIEKIDYKFLLNEVFGNHSIDIYELERFSTSKGWRFPHPPQHLREIATSKKALVLDDGSCSGESILQMIDEIAFLDVSEIIVVSIIGRVNDHKREFFSRIRSIKSNTGEIKVSIFFGSNWHIPTYNLAKSPVIEEQKKLESLIDFPNTPNFLKIIAQGVIDEVNPKSVNEGDNKFLVTSKSGETISHDLVLIRNEVGKIADYRFYKESFKFFDEFIAIYESKDKKIRGESPYQLIEGICAVLLHEPYLFDSMKKVIPDVVVKIKEFVNSLFWSAKKIELQDLHYSWSRKNLFHLVFIVYQNEELFEFLNAQKLNNLIKDFVLKNSDLNYLLFKLSYYLPINESEPERNNLTGKLHLLINQLIEYGNLNEEHLKTIKRFRSFSSTITTSGDFEASLSIVKTNYERITDDRYHNNWISTDHDALQMQLEIISEDYSSDVESKVKLRFENVSVFLDDLLAFSNSFKSFFKPLGQKVVTDIESNLRSMYGKLTDQIDQLSSQSDIQEIINLEKELYNNYVRSESYFYRVFKKIITKDLGTEFQKFIEEVKSEHEGISVKLTGAVPDGVQLRIPLIFITDVLFGQIQKNFRHADLSKPVQFHWTKLNKTSVVLKITNYGLVDKEVELGGGTGLLQLEALNDFPLEVINYSKIRKSDIFEQTIAFKI